MYAPGVRVAGRERRAAIVLFALSAAWCAHLAADFPALTEYRFGADEGTYLQQAGALVDGGLGGLREVARAYRDSPTAHDFPPPLRVGHLLLAAAALAVRRSIVALSWLSLACHAANVALIGLLGRRVFGARVALLAAALTLTAPLAGGLSLRALGDAHHTLSMTASVLALLAFVREGGRWRFGLYVGALAWSLLVKESAYLFLPFHLAVLAGSTRSRPANVRPLHLLVVAIAVPLATLGLTAALLGGVSTLVRIAAIATRGNALAPHPYLRAYGSGPWFEYLVDAMLLSPAATLAALFFAGARLARPRGSPGVVGALWFAAYGLAVLAFLPKNPRFAASLDLGVRIGAASMACVLADRLVARPRVRDALSVGIAALLMAIDVASFERHFGRARTYDPVAAALVENLRMVPVAPSAASAERPVDTRDRLISLSRDRLAAHDLATSMEASRAALALHADDADALNNLALALAEAGRFDEAIAALEAALRARPDFALARNNLAWIRERAATEH